MPKVRRVLINLKMEEDAKEKLEKMRTELGIKSGVIEKIEWLEYYNLGAWNGKDIERIYQEQKYLGQILGYTLCNPHEKLIDLLYERFKEVDRMRKNAVNSIVISPF